MKTKEFHIRVVLSITLGRVLAPLEDIREVVSFMSGRNVFVSQIALAARECRPYLLKQFPQLDSPEITIIARGDLMPILKAPAMRDNSRKLINEWTSRITSGAYGIKISEMLEVAEMPHEPR